MSNFLLGSSGGGSGTISGPSVGSAADGYVCFFTGATSIAGDNDFFWDRSLNQLQLSGAGGLAVSGGDISIKSNQKLIFDSDATSNEYFSGLASGQVWAIMNGIAMLYFDQNGINTRDNKMLRFGADNDYWHIYNSASTQYEFWTTDSNGAGLDGLIFTVDDGTDDVVFSGNISVGTDGYVQSTAGNLYLEGNDGYVVVDGDLHITGQAYSSLNITYFPVANQQTIDFGFGNAVVLNLDSASADVSVELANGIAGASYIIKVIQSTSSSYNIIWAGDILWPDGISPTISVGTGAIDIVTLFYDGINYYGTISQNYS